MKNIFINASELSIITGDNPYKPMSELIIKLFQKNFPTDYFDVVREIKNQKKKITRELKPREILDNLSRQTNIDVKQEINKCYNSNTTKELNNNKKLLKEKFKDKLTKEQIKKLEASVNDLTNTCFGTKQENKALLLYNQLTGVNVIPKTNYFTKCLFQTKLAQWNIGGKIDGITQDMTTVIEVKNRVNKLFYQLRDYEKIQAYAYMNILDKQKSQLVECLRTDNSQMNIIDIKYQKTFWNNHIEARIKAFIKLFEKIVKDPKLQFFILTETKENIDSFLVDFINKKLNK